MASRSKENEDIILSQFYNICRFCKKKYLSKYKLIHEFDCTARRTQLIETKLTKKGKQNLKSNYDMERLQENKEENEDQEEETKSNNQIQEDDGNEEDDEDEEDEDEDEEDTHKYFSDKKRKSKWNYRRSYSKNNFFGSSRKERGLTQKLFLIEVIPTDYSNERKFVVMGTTGNVYDVLISNKPECTCPDFVHRSSRCKHIYFVLLKVMKIDPNSRKRKFSDKDLETLFSNIPNITSNLIVNREIKDKYKKIVQQSDKCEDIEEEEQEEEAVKKQAIDDICPICMDDLKDGNALDYCKYSCGKSIHVKCFSMWCKKNEATCVFCRQPWEKEREKEKISAYHDSDEYINLLNR